MTRLALALALAAALMLAGCSWSGDDPSAGPTGPASSTSPAATPTAADPAPRPRLRSCYRIAYDDALAPTTAHRAVPCATEHTAYTFFVGTLDAVVDGHLLAVDSERVQAQVARVCPERLGGFVGGTLEQRRLSVLRATWFTPTVEQSDAGADWFRCDVIALRTNESLAALRGRLAGVLDSPAGRERYAMCGTAEPGTPDFERVLCPRSGVPEWRALRTVTFTAQRYPGEARVRAAGQTPCEDAGRAAADDALDFRWGYEWPTREQWDDGQTYGICWAPA